MPTIGPDKLIRARKQHRCDLCGRRIRKGATYYLREGVEGREHWRLKMHAVCRDATLDWDLDQWEVWTPGNAPEFQRYDLWLTPAGLLSLFCEIMNGGKRT